MLSAVPSQVIPVFSGPQCADKSFCWEWITTSFGSVVLPRLIEHIWISAIAVAVGLVISLSAALFAISRGWFEQGFEGVATFLYTVPSLAFFLVFVPITGLSVLTVEIGLVGYTLLLLFTNAIAGLRSAPPETLAAADGMGLTGPQVLFKIRLPLAVPSIMAGVRIAVVTAISLATIAAQAGVKLGLGAPIFDALHPPFPTELAVTGVLAVALALAADALVVGLQHLITPWARARR